jgi:murein DD-endopeptidase MepM/ murein hydrolase activator NlpD
VAGLLRAAAAVGVLLLASFFSIAQCSRRYAVAVPSAELRARGLQFPVPAASLAAMSDSFEDPRGARTHHAVDIMAPRGSPVVAVDDGAVAKLSTSPAGGIAVYQFDRAERHCYYYAHLERYAAGLSEGQAVKRGQVIGYVGTTGNAPRHRPHLHFAIAEVVAPKQWWGGRPIDPYPLWR